MSEIEEKYIIKNNSSEKYLLKNTTKKVIQEILGINNDIEIIDRSFILLNALKCDNDLALLYFNLKNNNIFIVEDIIGNLKFYNLFTKKAIDALESLIIINDLIDTNEIISSYVGYILHIKK